MQAIAKGFSQDIVVAEEVFGGFAALPGALAFLARIEDKVVGGCGGRIIPEARIASLFGTATLPEYRGRGVQSALIAQRLQEAGLAACEYAVVSTMPGGGSQRNMERRGFRLAYTKVVMMREWPEDPYRRTTTWTLTRFAATASGSRMSPRMVQWGGTLCLKLDGKLFAVASLESGPPRLSFKASAENFVELCERPTSFPRPTWRERNGCAWSG